MTVQDTNDVLPFLCARCGAELTPGKGDFYVVRIEALADPSPPRFSEEDLQHDHRAEIERLIEQMRDLSEQELTDQVYRRLVLYLCGPCYRRWIDNPREMSLWIQNLFAESQCYNWLARITISSLCYGALQ